MKSCQCGQKGVSLDSKKKEYIMKKNSRWNDTSGVNIIHHATEEERKELIEKMVETAINNVEKFPKNENNKGKDKK